MCPVQDYDGGVEDGAHHHHHHQVEGTQGENLKLKSEVKDATGLIIPS
jgi:hypothetical protein